MELALLPSIEMASVLESAIRSITIETSWLPPIVIDQPFAPAPPGGFNAAKFLQPKITIDTSFGPIVSAPYGAPVQNWPMLKLLALGLGGLLVVWAVKGQATSLHRKLRGRRAGAAHAPLAREPRRAA